MNALAKVEWVARFTRRLVAMRLDLDQFSGDRIANEQHRLNGDMWPERACENFVARMSGLPLDQVAADRLRRANGPAERE